MSAVGEYPSSSERGGPEFASAGRLGLEGRVALVTGAGGGLGRAHAKSLAARGAYVLVNDLGTDVGGAGRRADAAEEVVAEIRQCGGSAISNTDSVIDPGAAANMVESIIQRFGRLDIVVNNAGIVDEVPLAASDPAVVRQVIDTHLMGTVNVIRASWPSLVASGSGRIVNTSSGAVFGSAAGSAYQAAKAGIIAVTRSAALAGAEHGVKVNAILPTAFTRMTENIPDEAFREFMRTTFTPERVAELVVVLAHERCPVSGESFLAGGGRVARLVLAVTSGYISAEATAEEYLSHLDQVLDSAHLTIPLDRVDEFGSYLGQLGFGGADVLRSSGLSRGNRTDAESKEGQ